MIPLRCSLRHPHCWPGHAFLVQEYRAARQADLERLESETGLYPAEVAEWKLHNTVINFKAWLIGQAGQRTA